jgi:hypothetical protein
MVVPGRGEYLNIPINQAAKDFADAWDRQKEESAGHECSAYGAPALMEIPARLHITWADDLTLKVETDAGHQTRLLHFASAPPVSAPLGGSNPRYRDGPPPVGGVPSVAPGSRFGLTAEPAAPDTLQTPEPRSLQGWSVAEWQLHGMRQAGIGIGMAGAENEVRGPPDTHPPGSLKVITTRLTAGLLRKNGLPYSDQASMLEYWDVQVDSDTGLKILALTSELTDPTYLRAPYVHNPIYVAEPDASKWDPSPCSLEH